MRSAWQTLGVALAISTALVACPRKDRGSRPAPSGDGDVAPSAAADSGTRDDAGDGVRAWAVWTPRLSSEEEFLHYSKAIGSDRFTKLVVDLHTKAVYYVDAGLYPMHKDFIFAELLKTPRTKEAEQALDKNYGRNKPDFLMCYLVHHAEAGVWSLAFWDGDKATAEHVRLAFARVRETFYLGDQVKFRPNSNDQEAVAATIPEIPVVTNDALYKAAGYQPFHRGVAVGTLRVVKPGAEAAGVTFAPDEIVILPEPLSDITPVAGMVSESFSTPLSHVNLRAAAWGIPNAGLRGAAAKYGALEGKVVRFEAGATGATIREATPAEIAKARAEKRARTTVLVPKADLTRTKLAPLSVLRAADASAYGAKASNLGEIVHAKLPGVAVPPGFTIPIAHYEKHLAAAGIDRRVHAFLGNAELRASPEKRKAELEGIRRDIIAAAIAPALEKEIAAALAKLTGGAGEKSGVFVRSSTNAEDLPGFSGAGLYDTVPNVHGSEAVARAVKQVWASVWNLRAYEERELYLIDHKEVRAAVLVQIGVAATAAGVLVTAHPTDPDDTHTITINAKSGLGMRVVDGKKVPEILLYNTHNKGLRIVSRSDEDTMLVFQGDGGVREVPNAQKGAPVLTNERVQRLADVALKVRGVFPKDRPLDIEWVLRGEEVFVVQARPYMGGPAARGTSPR